MTRRMLILTLAAGLLALPAAASTFAAMDQAQLVAASDAVIQGRVLEVDSFWNRGATAILTEAKIQVDDVLAGDAPAEVTVRTFGGKVGDYYIDAVGFPTFHRGDEVVLFLQRAKDRSLRVTGYQLGQYRVVPNSKGGFEARPEAGRGMRLLYADGTPAPAPKALPLDTLKSEVRRFAQDKPALPRIK